MVILGVHGIYVYFSLVDLIFGFGATWPKLFLAIPMPGGLQGCVLWMTGKGAQSWFIPAVFLAAGILLWSCRNRITRAIIQMVRKM